MIVEGFCTIASADEPIDATGFCLPHNHVAIPPSYGKRAQRFTGGTWVPFIPRPVGYQYKPRFVDPVKAPNEPTTYTCQWCGGSFTSSTRGTPPSYCTSIHRSAAANARKREARRAVAS